MASDCEVQRHLRWLWRSTGFLLTSRRRRGLGLELLCASLGDSAKVSTDTTSQDVLRGGGEMGALMRAIDWSANRRRPGAAWPQSLRTALSILLETGFPMYIAWGPEFTQFYNDGYRPILGSTKHPARDGRQHARDLRRDLGHHRPDVRRRDAGHADDGRRLPAAARPPRLPRGVLLHLLVQPDPRGGRRGRRRARHGHRDDRSACSASAGCKTTQALAAQTRDGARRCTRRARSRRRCSARTRPTSRSR